MAREFNALNGREVSAIIQHDIAKAIEGNEQFRQHLTYPQISWKWSLTVKAKQNLPDEFSVTAEGQGTIKDAITVLPSERSLEGPNDPAPDEVREDVGMKADPAEVLERLKRERQQVKGGKA